MTVKQLTNHHLECLRGYTGSLGSIHVKMPHCWKSHVRAHIMNSIDNDVKQFQVFYSHR